MKADKRRKSRANEEWIPTSFKKWNSVVENFNRYEEKPKEKVNFFLKLKEGVLLTILNRGMKKILLNKLFLLVTILSILAFLASNLLGIFVLKPEKLDLKTICNTWVPFGILIFYVMFFEIFSINMLFYEDHHEGIFNLEIRSGCHKFKIFVERMLANKIIIWIILSFLIFLQVIFGYLGDNLYIKIAVQHTWWGFLLIYLIDFFFFGFLVMFSNLGSFLVPSVLGTIIGLFLICGTILNLVSVKIVENKINKDNPYSLQEKNAKYPFILRMQKLMEKYGDQDSILGQSIQAFYELKDLVTDFRFNNEKGFFTHNQIIIEKYLSWNFLNKPHYNYDDYLIELMANGLILNINEIPVYTELSSDANPTSLETNFSLMENNFIFQFLNQLVAKSNPSPQDSQTSTAANSLFRGYQASEDKTSHLFEEDDGLFAFIQAISSDQDEIKELGSLIQDAAIYLYQDKYRNYPSEDFDNIAPSLETDFQAHIWKYDLQQDSNYNQELLENVWISDGARTFIKIFFELLFNLMSLEKPDYGQDEEKNLLTADEYNHEAQLFTYLNPFTALTRTFYEFSGDESYLATNYVDGWCEKTYEVWDEKEDLGSVVKFADDNQFLRIYLTQNYFNDSELENAISLEELNSAITSQMKHFIPSINLDFFLDFNKKIPIEKTNEGFVIDFQVAEHQEINYRNYVNIKLVFPLVSREFDDQQKQQDQLFAAFLESYQKFSPFFNKFLNGKNYLELKTIEPNFMTNLPLFTLPVLGLIELCAAYWIFSRCIIK